MSKVQNKDDHASIKVAVLEGGMSVEREVSLESGKQVKAALENLGYIVIPIDMQSNIIEKLKEVKPDVVFNALHGKYGEDGCIAGALEIASVPYTHSSVLASAIAMNKTMAKKLFSALKIQTPKGQEYTKEEFLDIVKKGQDNDMRPYVIKPVSEGSSIGVHIIREGTNNVEKIVEEWAYGPLMVEEFIPGREITVSVLNGRALGVTELVTEKDEFYNYGAKYTDGKTVHIIPAQIPDEVTKRACEIAEEAHKGLGCRVVSRSDFRYNDQKNGNEGVYLLETNTHPGLTPLSLLPEAAKYNGITFEQVVKTLVDGALS